MAEIEGKGLDYERFAMRKLFRRLVPELELQSVLELPAKGEKAMPSLYSLAFAEAGCAVTLVDPQPQSRWAWEKLGYPVTWLEGTAPDASGLPDAAFDLVWNFMFLSQVENKARLLSEMRRLSRRWVLYIGVNRFNPGFFSHRAVHRWFDVPWTHGDVRFMNPFHVARYFREHGLCVRQQGIVDAPPYPDSLGFRDMRLHRMNVDLNEIDWDSRTLGWMQADRYPLKLHLLYLFERLPLPWRLKLIYSHLFWVLAEVTPHGRN